MKLLFNLDDVICTPAKGITFGIVEYIKHCRPIEDTTEFMLWLRKNDHHITIWCERPNDLAVKLATEEWLKLHQVPYDRVLFDRPSNYVSVDEVPAHAKFYKHLGDLGIVAGMYEEWKNDRQHEQRRGDTR
tara:strand:- start:1863 stop:2255 length:393 start_codon:yes stop_codon:yes gene_type:complete